MTNTLTTQQDCADFVHGCLFMGTGGGGDPTDGTAALLGALDEGHRARLGGRLRRRRRRRSRPRSTRRAPWRPTDDDAVQALIRSLRLDSPTSTTPTRWFAPSANSNPTSVSRSVPSSPSNSAHRTRRNRSSRQLVSASRSSTATTPAALHPRRCSALRSSTTSSSVPFSSADRWGNVALVTRTPNAYMLERITKMLSIAGIDGTVDRLDAIVRARHETHPRPRNPVDMSRDRPCGSRGGRCRPRSRYGRTRSGWWLAAVRWRRDSQRMGGPRWLHVRHCRHQGARHVRRSPPPDVVQEREPRDVARRAAVDLQPRPRDLRRPDDGTRLHVDVDRRG